MGHVAFAAIMIVLGIWGVSSVDFAPVWQPVPADVPGREVLVYLGAVVSIAGGIGLLVRRTAGHAARALLACLAAWLLGLRIREILHAHGAFEAWDGCAETAVMVAGAWALYAVRAPAWDRRYLGFATGDRGLRIARALYGLALVPFGLAHFVFARQTAVLVPAVLPAHLAWAYATGGAFLLASAAVLLGIRPRLAATLVAVQIGGFTLLVWIPRVASGGATAFDWSELGISAALTAAAWVMADSYVARPSGARDPAQRTRSWSRDSANRSPP
jgi:uncharacterized membrane protein